MSEVGYKKLIVWRKADELAYKIYVATRDFPKSEIYGITSPFRRAGLSIALNIVEGYGRQNRKELRQFVNIGLGSLEETKYLLEFSLKLNYLKKAQYEELESLAIEVEKLLWKFYKSI